MDANSQCSQLLRYLKRHGSITPLTALDTLGIYRLAARCYDLRRMGYDIKTTMVYTRNDARIARYSL